MLMVMAATMVACSKWDDYKQYTANGETLYTGRLDSIKVFPGRQRVKITGLLSADPKITRVKITWNAGKDSAIYPIVKGAGVDSFSKIINVPEGITSFSVRTYDDAGNSSMVTDGIATAYGPKYESGLSSRPVFKAELLSNGSAEVTWDNFDTTTGAKASFVEYITATNATATIMVPASQKVTLLPNFKSGGSINVRTQYLPVPAAIDTFSSAPQTVGVYFDVTNTYFKNAGPGIISTPASGTGRWRIPQDWTVTDDVRNGGSGLGGLDAGSWLPSFALSIEAWSGMPEVPNGKIYQTITLPAGKYSYVVTAGDCSDGGTKYLTVAAGAALPNIGNVTTQSIVFKAITKNVTNTLPFELKTATQVSIGMQGNLPAQNNFMKVFKVQLYKLP